jgi:hypothetical protein
MTLWLSGFRQSVTGFERRFDDAPYRNTNSVHITSLLEIRAPWLQSPQPGASGFLMSLKKGIPCFAVLMDVSFVNFMEGFQGEGCHDVAIIGILGSKAVVILAG